jgi:hypothetical protein
MGFHQDIASTIETSERSTRGRLGTTREDSKTTQRSAGVPSSLEMIQAFLRTFGLWNSGTLKDYSPRPSRLLEDILLDYKVLRGLSYGHPGPTTQAGTGPTTAWAPGATRLRLHGARRRGAQGNWRASTRIGN